MCVCVSVASVIVKCPVLPPRAVDGHSTNPLYYYYYYIICSCCFLHTFYKLQLFYKKAMEMKLYLNKDVHQDFVHTWYNLTPTQPQRDSIVQRRVRTFKLNTFFCLSICCQRPFWKFAQLKDSCYCQCFNGHSENLHNWRIRVFCHFLSSWRFKNILFTNWHHTGHCRMLYCLQGTLLWE